MEHNITISALFSNQSLWDDPDHEALLRKDQMFRHIPRSGHRIQSLL